MTVKTLALAATAAALILAQGAQAQTITTYVWDGQVGPLGTYSWESFEGGKSMPLSMGIGSGAFRHPADPAMQFYAVSDRGPNFHCGDVEKMTGVSADVLCTESPEGLRGRLFPLEDYTPSLHTVVLNDDGTFSIKDVMTIKDAAGAPVTGILNPLSLSSNEAPLDGQGALLDFDPNGVDGEGVVKLDDGSFWIADENAPSIFHIDATGRLQARLVPAGAEVDFAKAGYPVMGTLPAIYAKRHLNRGIESVALDTDGHHLHIIMQSPLDNPTTKTYGASRNVRILTIDSATLRPTAEYVYVEDTFDTFALDNGKKQSDVRISEMHMLGPNRLLVLERISKTTKLYEIDLTNATNILDTAWSDPATSPSLEELEDVAAAGVTPVTKVLRFNTADYEGIPNKIEGIAFLGDGSMALINDNDFGIAGAETKVIVVSDHGMDLDL